jgi:hypothetical protein
VYNTGGEENGGVGGKMGYISKMYFSHWKPPGLSERMWSVNLDASISEDYQTLGEHFCRHSEELGAPTTSLGAPGTAGDIPGSAGDNSGSTSNHSRAVWENNFFGNASGAPGNHSYCLSFKDF